VRSVLITAAALVALASPATAAPRQWYHVDFDAFNCVPSLLTPEQAARLFDGGARISPQDVRGDADGDVNVLVHGNFHGKPSVDIFYSSKAKCDAVFSGKSDN
jgi:hypothetical protein